MDRVVLSLLLLLCWAGCSKEYDPPIVPTLPLPTLTIADLKELYRGEILEVKEELVVAGRITSSDEAGNLYHALYIEERGAAIELMVDQTQLFRRYPVGCRVHLRLKGLALGKGYGVVRVGRLSSLYKEPFLEEIASQPLLDEQLFRTELPLEVMTPELVEISDLTDADCGRLVRVDNLIFLPEEPAEEPTLWAGLHRFVDPRGEELYLSVSAYARFADEPIPTGILSLQGILRKGNLGYQILPRDEQDLVLAW